MKLKIAIFRNFPVNLELLSRTPFSKVNLIRFVQERLVLYHTSASRALFKTNGKINLVK